MREVHDVELQLLLHCARTRIDGDKAQRIADLLERADWARLMAWTERHGVNALMLRTLSSIGSPEVPAEFLDRLRAKCEAIRFQNLVLVRELHRAFHVLETAGIPAAAYKGAALSAFLYQDIGLREFSDVDVLVRPGDALNARRALLDKGFVSRSSLPARLDKLYVRFHCSFPLAASPSGVLIDLNWRVAPWYWRLPEIPDSAWGTLSLVPVAGRPVPWFAPEHVLFVLCLHGCMHKWELLKWIVDIAELLRVRPDLDWKLVTAYMRKTGSERMLALGLFLASDLLDAPVPADVFDDIVRQDAVVPRLAQEVYERVFAVDRVHIATIEELPFMARAASRYETKLYCRALIPAYFLLHHVVRPSLQGLRRRLAL